jgi:hypothetical protein
MIGQFSNVLKASTLRVGSNMSHVEDLQPCRVILGYIVTKLHYHSNLRIFRFSESDSWNCPTINYILTSVN